MATPSNEEGPDTTAAASQMSKPESKPEKKKRPNFKENPTQFITLIADKDNAGVKFGVHKDFACHYSPVLEAAFNSDFIEGQTQSYNFPEYEADAIRALVEWIYTQKISGIYLETDPQRKQFRDASLLLCKLWTLADNILVPKLQNYVIHELKITCVQFKRHPLFCLEYVYRSTNSESRLRRWCFQYCIRNTLPRIYLNLPHVFPKEMLLEMAEELMKDGATGRRGIPSDDDMTVFEVPEDPKK